MTVLQVFSQYLSTAEEYGPNHFTLDFIKLKNFVGVELTQDCYLNYRIGLSPQRPTKANCYCIDD